MAVAAMASKSAGDADPPKDRKYSRVATESTAAQSAPVGENVLIKNS